MLTGAFCGARCGADGRAYCLMEECSRRRDCCLIIAPAVPSHWGANYVRQRPSIQEHFRRRNAPSHPNCRATARGTRASLASFSLVIAVWFPYVRWSLLVILNLSRTIAVRALLIRVIYPTTAITMWANLHCRLSYQLLRVVIWRTRLAVTSAKPIDEIRILSQSQPVC
jgi:hypothetical protein